MNPLEYLKKLLIITFTSMVFFCQVEAQTEKITIEGRILDAQSGKPLVLVNVFLAQTTFGSATDNNGFFKILNVPLAEHSLVASMVGYESNVITIKPEKSKRNFYEMKLTPKTYEMEEVSVKDEEDTEWKKQLEFFKKLFFGYNELAKSCEIENPYYINFSEDRDKFVAETSEPIYVRNNALGYRLECILKYFEFRKSNNAIIYTVLPKFIEITPSDKDSLEVFVENRKTTYYGSAMHLLASLAASNYKFRDEGFELMLDGSIVNKAEEIVKYEKSADKYYLSFRGCVNIKYWNRGKNTNSTLCLRFSSTEFNPDGYLLFPGEFNLYGDMAREGVATMLPRFLEFNKDKN